MKNKFQLAFALSLSLSNVFCQTYSFPDESEPHEGTWLQWPHHYEYGLSFRNENDATWVAMTSALQANEKVHIIAYNATEQTRIINLLQSASVPLTNIDFKIFPTNDVWVRDNGPIYVRNANDELVIQDWGFNAWGEDYNFNLCNPIPTSVANSTGISVLDLNQTMTVEGGSWEMDGNGTFMATKSSILCQANPIVPFGIYAERNVGMTQAEAEDIFTQYLGATDFIWLDGFYSSDDITDAHIDGFAKFAPGNKLVTMSQVDLLYWGVVQTDINILYAATNSNGTPYSIITLPLTANDVVKTNGTNLGYKGSYANYYVANNRVLVPNYADPNDAVANAIITGLYPGRTVVGIDVRNLYGNGGMVHCVTQQQPTATEASLNELENKKLRIFPNPTSDYLTLDTNSPVIKYEIINELGEQMILKTDINSNQTLYIGGLKNGCYFIKVELADSQVFYERIIKS